MKNLKFLIILSMLIGAMDLQAQITTSYGVNAGSSGSYNSFFGYYSGWATTGNYNTASGAFSLYTNTTGQQNVAIGYSSLRKNTLGEHNTGVGMKALYNNTEGDYNVALGSSALNNNTLGYHNVGTGYYVLYNNNTGIHNVATGSSAMYSNTYGNYNVATGSSALFYNTTGSYNVATGNDALKENITGYKNTAIGNQALEGNLYGYQNAAMGADALNKNTTGDENVAIGVSSLEDNTTGDENTATGYYALKSNIGGRENVAMGTNALTNHTTGSKNVAIGAYSSYYPTSGNYNTTIGYLTGAASGSPSYTNSTAIGYNASIVGNNQVRIGNTSITSIKGFVGFSTYSDGRFKKEVKENVLGLDFVKALRPVSYYVDKNALNEFLDVTLDKSIVNNEKHYQTGFIAQEVESAAKELGFEHFSGVDAPQSEKDHYALRYAEFVVPLVKSVQELSEQNDQQAATIETLKEAMAQQQLQISDLLDQQNATLNTGSTSTASKAKLHQNIPNPFSNETQINLFIPAETGQALIQVCTIDGKQLFVKEVEGRNETSVIIAGNDLPAGIYMYTLIVDHEIITSKRMVLTK